MRIITRNAIRCKKCGDVIESKTVHDFQQCSCGACFVDGGKEYVRVGGNMEDIEMLTEYKDKPGYKFEVKTHYGSTRKFETTEEPQKLIDYYEDQWDHVRVCDESGKEIYKSKGFDKKHGQKYS